jgi:hypothetical protein
MSITTLKRKTSAKYNNSSVGQKQFSINGTTKNQGWVGQTSLSRSFPMTPFLNQNSHEQQPHIFSIDPINSIDIDDAISIVKIIKCIDIFDFFFLGNSSFSISLFIYLDGKISPKFWIWLYFH